MANGCERTSDYFGIYAIHTLDCTFVHSMNTGIFLNFHEFWKSRKLLPVHIFLKNSWLCKLIYLSLSLGLRKSKLFMGTIAMDGCEIEVQCSIVGFWCHLRMLLSPLIMVKICMLMIRQVSCDLIVNWSRFAPCDFNMLQSRARRLSVRVNGMTVYLLLSLRNPFTLMSVSSSVDN